MNDILFKCPRCNKDITKNDFTNHDSNWTLIENYLKELEEEKINEIRNSVKQELITQLNNQHQSEINLLKEQMQSSFNQSLNEYQLNIQNKDNQIKQLNDQKALELSEIENSLIQKFNDTQKDLEIKLSSKDLELKSINEKLNLEVEKNKQQLMNEFSNQINELRTQLITKENEFKNFSEKSELERQLDKQELVNQYQKQIGDLVQANRDFKIINSKRKGENFEHEVEAELQKSFSLYDTIEKITVGDKKADYLQTIKNSKQQVVGKIVYEVKNAEWSNAWVSKLAVDVANNKTKYGILIATSFNDKYHGIPFIKSSEYENIWITDSESFIFVGQMLRRFIELEYEMVQKEKALTNNLEDEQLKELQLQKNKLNSYWTINFPTAYKKVKKEIDALEKVSTSLESNASKINKSVVVIKQQFMNKVTKALTDIFGFNELEDKRSNG